MEFCQVTETQRMPPLVPPAKASGGSVPVLHNNTIIYVYILL